MQHLGRRALYLWGTATMFTILVIVGFLGLPEPSKPIVYASISFLFIFTLVYDVTVGPTAYCLITEIPSARLRIKTAVLGRNCYNVLSILADFLNNPILNPTAWNLRGKGGFVWCGFCLLSFVWSYYRLPEPKGLSAGELNVLFEQKVPARKFGVVKADPFRIATQEDLVAEEDSERVRSQGAPK